MARPILLFGREGQLGRELVRELRFLGPVVALGRSEVDLADADAVRESIRRVAPGAIVNASAHTAVDRAEGEQALAFSVNATAVEAMASEAARANALLVHFSTDYVFDGTATRPYVETDVTGPAGVYGASKRAGEDTVVSSDARFFIFRLGWVYALHGRNFLRTMLRLFAEQPEVRVVSDQVGSPTWAAVIAGAVGRVLYSCRSDDGRYTGADDRLGLYHLSSGDAGSWYDFANAIHELFPGGHRVERITPITTADYPTAAVRPAYSVLSPQKFNDAFGIALPPWREQLELAASVSAR